MPSSPKTIPTRNYTCFSPLCDGAVRGLDSVPKPEGRGAVCWSCGSDLYTLPRYGATSEHVKQHPKVTPVMLATHAPSVVFGPMGWMQAFAGMTITRPEGASE